jgi:hypothetical protein
MSEQHPPDGLDGPPPTEEELRAAYEAELKQLRVEDVVIQTIVSLLNLGGRKAGLAPGTEDERDLEQVAMAIEGVRRLMPFVEEVLGPDGQQLKDALAQLQMAFVRLGGSPPPGAGGAPGPPPPPAEPARPAAPPPPRLWTPGS